MPKGFGNMGNMGGMMKQAQQMMAQMQRLEEELETERIQATSGGGVITATVSGKGELLSLDIKPEVVDPEDIEMLQDLLITAIREAEQKADDLRKERLGPVTGGLNMPGLF